MKEPEQPQKDDEVEIGNSSSSPAPLMIDPTGSSQPYKRFLRAFFGPLTFEQWRDGSFDIRSLSRLSDNEKNLAEELLLQHLEQGSTDPRIVSGLRELRSQRAIPVLKHLVLSSSGERGVLRLAVVLWELAHAQEALSALIEALAGWPDFWGRMDAAISLRYCRCQQAAQALQQALSDEAPLVRFHATNSLLILYAPWRESRGEHPLAIQLMSADPQKQEDAIVRILALTRKRPLLPECIEENEGSQEQRPGERYLS